MLLRRFHALGFTCKEMYSIVVQHGLPLLAAKLEPRNIREEQRPLSRLGGHFPGGVQKPFVPLQKKELMRRVLENPNALLLPELQARLSCPNYPMQYASPRLHLQAAVLFSRGSRRMRRLSTVCIKYSSTCASVSSIYALYIMSTVSCVSLANPSIIK